MWSLSYLLSLRKAYYKRKFLHVVLSAYDVEQENEKAHRKSVL